MNKAIAVLLSVAACGADDPLDQDSVACGDDWQPGVRGTVEFGGNTLIDLTFTVIDDDRRRCPAVCESTVVLGALDQCEMREGVEPHNRTGVLCPTELTLDLGNGRSGCCIPRDGSAFNGVYVGASVGFFECVD